MLRNTMLLDSDVYKFQRHTSRLHGYDVYKNGVWIAWTAGNLTDARKMAKDMAKKGAPGVEEEG